MSFASDSEGFRNVALAVIALGVVVAGLVLGSPFLIPLATAILIWNLLIGGIERIGIGPHRLPRWFATIVGIARRPE
jgi:hypothetical protein